MMIWIDVDFNALDGQRRLLASQRYASGPLIEGETVAVVDEVEDMRYAGTVVKAGADGRAVIEVDWNRPLTNEEILAGGSTYFPRGARWLTRLGATRSSAVTTTSPVGESATARSTSRPPVSA